MEAQTIILDLPAPPSVNRTRRVNWAARRVLQAWKNVADAYVLAAKRRADQPVKLTRVPRFELAIVVSEDHTNMDLDNGVKSLIDYLKTIECIQDDAKKNMRKFSVEWGEAPHGCRVTVRPCA